MCEPIKNAYVWVAGGRDYDDYARVETVLNTYREKYGIRRIVTGGADGADTLAEAWAGDAEIPYVGVPARWKTEGKAAGPKRNERIAAEEKPDVLIAFPGGAGIRSAMMIAFAHNIPVFEIDPARSK